MKLVEIINHKSMLTSSSSKLVTQASALIGNVFDRACGKGFFVKSMMFIDNKLVLAGMGRSWSRHKGDRVVKWATFPIVEYFKKDGNLDLPLGTEDVKFIDEPEALRSKLKHVLTLC